MLCSVASNGRGANFRALGCHHGIIGKSPTKLSVFLMTTFRHRSTALYEGFTAYETIIHEYHIVFLAKSHGLFEKNQVRIYNSHVFPGRRRYSVLCYFVKSLK